jgi:sarcosine oxidase delta subunit
VAPLEQRKEVIDHPSVASFVFLRIPSSRKRENHSDNFFEKWQKHSEKNRDFLVIVKNIVTFALICKSAASGTT